MISFSAGSFTMGAHVRYGRLSTFHPLMEMPLARKGLRLVSYGGRARPSGTSAGRTSPSADTLYQPFCLSKRISSGKSGARMWPARPMDTQSSPSTVKRYTCVL